MEISSLSLQAGSRVDADGFPFLERLVAGRGGIERLGGPERTCLLAGKKQTRFLMLPGGRIPSQA